MAGWQGLPKFYHLTNFIILFSFLARIFYTTIYFHDWHRHDTVTWSWSAKGLFKELLKCLSKPNGARICSDEIEYGVLGQGWNRVEGITYFGLKQGWFAIYRSYNRAWVKLLRHFLLVKCAGILRLSQEILSTIVVWQRNWIRAWDTTRSSPKSVKYTQTHDFLVSRWVISSCL